MEFTELTLFQGASAGVLTLLESTGNLLEIIPADLLDTL